MHGHRVRTKCNYPQQVGTRADREAKWPMKAYISVSYKKRKSFDAEINAIVEVLNEADILSIVFVDQYKFDPSQEKEMMKMAIEEIDSCDLLLAETSDKGIGIGIEVGYAKAKGKSVVYVRSESAEHSTTVSGISDFQVVYSNTDNLKQKLSEVVMKLKSRSYR